MATFSLFPICTKSRSLTVEKARQIPIAHELVDQNVLALLDAVSDQINKISMVQPTKQNYLGTKEDRGDHHIPRFIKSQLLQYQLLYTG